MTTLDGYKLKKYDMVWELGVTTDHKYKPCRTTYGKPIEYGGIHNKERCWYLYENALKEAEKLNNKNTL